MSQNITIGTTTETVYKKPRKPRTKKADMIKKKEEMAKLKESQPPKKRGRKPKGGKIIKSTEINFQEEQMEEKKIILHLKCHLKDIQKCDIYDITNYDPNVIQTIQPYDMHENNSTFTHIEHSETNNVIKDKKHYESNQCDMKEYKNMKKNIQDKLKDLEKQFNLNQNNKQSCCFWCTCEFNTKPIYIPSLFFQNKYDVYGCFCSPECACSHLFQQNIDNNTKYERYQLLNYIYGKIYNYKKEIKPAPDPHYLLDKFYGNLTIQEYRQMLTFDRLILIIDKPLTKIYPELHEDNNEFETLYENKLSLKKKDKVDKNVILNNVFHK